MSDTIVTTDTTVTTAAPSKPKREAKGGTVKDAARARIVARKGKVTDESLAREGKRVRAFIRAHKSDLGKLDPSIKSHQKGADYAPFNARSFRAIVKNEVK